jgi:hypothetical protein
MLEINDFEVENKVNGFVMENADKLSRVIFGEVRRAGVMEGGLGVDEAEKNPSLVLAHYDKLAGRITKDGVKIKMGSFWDFKLKQPRKEPQVMFVFNIGGEFVEVDDPKNLAEAISTVEKVKAKKEVKFKEAKAKSKFKESNA